MHEPESAERVLGDVAAVADVEDDDVVAVLGHEAHAAVRHSPTTPAIVFRLLKFILKLFGSWLQIRLTECRALSGPL